MRWTIAGPVFAVSILAGVMLTSVARFAYEFRNSTGNWPSDISQLGLDRRLSSRFSYRGVVLAHPRYLSRSPSANREKIIAYQYTGKRLWPYRWVCWGDLRTEYISNRRFERTMASQWAAEVNEWNGDVTPIVM